MKSLYLALLFSLSLFSTTCFDMGGNWADQYAGNFINQYAGNYMKGGNPGQGAASTTPTPAKPETPATPAAPEASKTAAPGANSKLSEAEGFENTSASTVFSDLACSDAMDKTNGAITQLTRAVSMAKDKWGIYGYAQKLSKSSEKINSDCELINLKLVNLGRSGVNRAQDAACKTFLQLVKATIASPPTEIGPPADYVSLLNFSKKTLDISKSLGKQCQIALIDKTEEIPPLPLADIDDDGDNLDIEYLLADDDDLLDDSKIEADLVNPNKLTKRAKF